MDRYGKHSICILCLGFHLFLCCLDLVLDRAKHHRLAYDALVKSLAFTLSVFLDTWHSSDRLLGVLLKGCIDLQVESVIKLVHLHTSLLYALKLLLVYVVAWD